MESDSGALMVSSSYLKGLVKGRVWKVSDFRIGQIIGKGTFSKVHFARLATRYAGNAPFALKVMSKATIVRTKQVAHVLGERDVMNLVSHPFIVTFLTSFMDETNLYLLMEFVNGGDLFSRIRSEGRFPNDHARFYSGEIVLALSYLHTVCVVYRDLKPENVLICADGHVKLADFGFAKVIDSLTFTLCGTAEYLAPEIITQKGHSKEVDWWAFGVLIFEMLAGVPPFSGNSPFETYQQVLECKPTYPRYIDVKARDLIGELLQPRSQSRLGSERGKRQGSEDVKRHKWYKGIDWDRMLNRALHPPFTPKVSSAMDTSLFEEYPDSDTIDDPLPPELASLFEFYPMEV